jgi:hypothetical protein
MPQLWQILCCSAPFAQGHLKHRDTKRNGHSGLGLLSRYTAPFGTNIRYLSPLAIFGYLPSKPGIPPIERDTYNDQ